MSRIAATFTALREQNKKAMIPFVTVGDPNAEASLSIMFDLVANGADLIELGVPFSDPMADGAVIQRASERALRQGMTLTHVLQIVKEFRRHNDYTPVILMGYLNPIEAMGYEVFTEQAQAQGVDAVLLVDMPPEEAASFNAVLSAKGLDQIFLVSPTTTESRIKLIAEYASGFIYYVAVRGVTGKSKIDMHEVKDRIMQLHKHTALPVGVGFGIADADSAAEVASFSDAVVIGSALIENIHFAVEQQRDISAVIQAFLTPVRTALNQVSV